MGFYLPKTPKDDEANVDTEEIVDFENKFNAVFYNYQINLWSLPVGIGSAFLFSQFWVFSHLSTLFCTIPLHEMGHAMSAWMLGYFGIPLGAIVPTAGMTIVGSEPHWWMRILFFSVLGFLFYRSYREKVPFFLGLTLIIASLSIYLSYSLHSEQEFTLISFGGVAGEFMLASVLIISFYHPLFKKMRWDYFRYPFFVMGCFCFVNAVMFWVNVKNKLAKVPYGSAVSAAGSSDSDGDMNKLVASGWSEDFIMSNYILIAKICCTVILIQYAYKLIDSRQKEN